MAHFIFKSILDRWDLEQQLKDNAGYLDQWSTTQQYKKVIRPGHNALIYVGQWGFAAAGIVKVPPPEVATPYPAVYEDGGFDPRYANDPVDVVRRHWYVELDMPLVFFDTPVPWAEVAADPAWSGRSLGQCNPIMLTDDDYVVIMRQIARRLRP